MYIFGYFKIFSRGDKFCKWQKVQSRAEYQKPLRNVKRLSETPTSGLVNFVGKFSHGIR